MAAKELKALVDIGTSLGYTREDLKQWLNDEKKRQEEEKRPDKKRGFELEKLKIEAQKESERMKLEAEAERAKIEAEKESERRRQEFELQKIKVEHDLRLREVQVNVEQDGGGEGGVPRSNRGHSVATKALKLPLGGGAIQ